LNYQRSTSLSCKDIGIRKNKFVAKTQFLSEHILETNIFFVNSKTFSPS